MRFAACLRAHQPPDALRTPTGKPKGAARQTPTMVDICEFTDDSGVPSEQDAEDAVEAFRDDELSRDEVQDVIAAFRQNEPLSECVPEPDPDPDPDPPDESELLVNLSGLTQPEPGVIEVGWEVAARPVSGDGEGILAGVSITVDGNTVDEFSTLLAPRDSDSGTVVIEDVSPGEREICVVGESR